MDQIMTSLETFLNSVFAFVTPVSDFLWEFPTNYEWWSNIPIIGSFALSFLVLVGSGIYFTFKLRFVQIRHFKPALKILLNKNKDTSTGLSPFAAFMLSTAMRIGAGNIVSVTGAIAIGGPGALFWMWVSAFFGMATCYVESTLSQIFKRKDGDEFVGGLPFYGRKLVKDSAAVGVGLSVVYIIYAFTSTPSSAFHTTTAIATIANTIVGYEIPAGSMFYWIVAIIMLILLTIVAFGGLKSVAKVSDAMVPAMAVIYFATALVLIVINLDRIPYFFAAVFTGAFKPDALFGGAFGVALLQGIKRGVASNEAGQGTITMPAAAAVTKDPCEQGMVQSLGVFLDTIVICTLTGFIVVMGSCWLTSEADAWMAMDKFPKFVASVAELTPGTAFNNAVTILVSLCYAMFAFTCLLGFTSFSEMSAARISSNKNFIVFIRVLSIAVMSFGLLCRIAGYTMDNLWAITDLGNIMIVYFNIPLLWLGFKSVKIAIEHYDKHDGTQFTGEMIGMDLDYWHEGDVARDMGE